MLTVVAKNKLNDDAPEVLIQLENPANGLLVERLAQLNTKQSMMEIDADTCNQLGFDLGVCQYKQIKLNGAIATVPVVGPLRIYLQNSFCDCSALVSGKSVALGLSAMQML
jgi:hypothetical protein